MVCVAAFIILCLLSVFVAILSIFRRDIGKKYWRVFKKAWGCVGRRVTFRKCDTNFKEDVKNSILKKFIIKKPKLVKPISIGIEITAVLIVLVTIWSLVEAAKAGLALYALGSCNVRQPESCVINSSANSCTVQRNLNWFEEWGYIFSALPDRTRNWQPTDYLPENPIYRTLDKTSLPIALDIMDPGCIFCLQSYINQRDSGFFDRYNAVLFPYVTQKSDGTDRYVNSDLIARYLLASATLEPTSSLPTPWRIIDRLFTEYGTDADGSQVIYQALFNDHYSAEQAEQQLLAWLKDFGYAEAETATIQTLAHSPQIISQMEANRKIAESKIHITNVPTIIYNGKKHSGLFTHD